MAEKNLEPIICEIVDILQREDLTPNDIFSIAGPLVVGTISTMLSRAEQRQALDNFCAELLTHWEERRK